MEATLTEASELVWNCLRGVSGSTSSVGFAPAIRGEILSLDELLKG